MNDQASMRDQGKQKLPPLEDAEKWERRRRRRRALSWLGGITILTVAAAMWISRYGYPNWQQYRGLLARVPGLEQSFDALGERMVGVENKLRNWAADQESLREQMAQLDEKARQNLQSARHQTQEMVAKLSPRLAELDLKTGALQARVGQIESGEESDNARVAKLEHEIAGVRREIADQLAGLRQDAGRDLAQVDQKLTGLNQQVDRGQRDLDTLTRRMDGQRLDFEVARNHSRQIAPGISFGVTRTDIRYRRVDGWLWLMPDRRTVWVRGQGVQQPVIFYGKEDGKRREMVITTVTKNAVVGYVLLPVAGSAAAARAAATSSEGSEPVAPSEQ